VARRRPRLARQRRGGVSFLQPTAPQGTHKGADSARIPNASETPARTRALALSAGASARIDQPAGVNQHDHSLISMQSRATLSSVHPQDSPRVRSERTPLSPRGTRAAGPWGRPWPPPECAPRGPLRATAGPRRPPPRRAARIPEFQFSSSPGRRPHRVVNSCTDPISDSPMVGRFSPASATDSPPVMPKT
jgi:hypothetical protein